MFLNLFDEMKNAKIPVSLREYLTFLEALTAGVEFSTLMIFTI